MKLNLDKKKRYLLACSYGPDSMCLFDLLVKGGFHFSVANVNYNLRKESKKEQADLKKYCKKNNIEIFDLNVKEEITNNIEEKCREIRYSFFEEVYKTNAFEGLLVAHNEDDHLETYLLQKKRGGIVEHFGLQNSSVFKGMDVYRPLLSYSKKSLQEYDDGNNVPYCIDESNNEDKYERNIIRHSVIQNMDENERLRLKTQIDYENIELIKKHKDLIALKTRSIEDILKLDDEDFAYYLVCQSRKFYEGVELSKNRVGELRKILVSEKPNIITQIKDDLFLVKSYENFDLKILNKETNFCYILEKPGELDTPFFYLNFTKSSQDRNVYKSDYPLTIRNATKEDEILIKNYRVSMRREFINWKVPAELRERWPVIENKDHQIIYVPRYNKHFKIDDTLNFYVKI